ncbi:hypothetical protein D3C86_1237380 [compost metagenome]
MDHAVLVGEAFLDQLLGVVPGPAARGHRDGHEQAGHDHPHQHGAQGGEGVGLVRLDEQHHDEQDDRRQHRQQAGHDHLADGRAGQDVHGPAVFGLCLERHDAGVLAELTTNLGHDGLGCAPDRRHRHAAEQEGQQAPEQQAYDHVGVGQVKGDCAHSMEEAARRRLGGEELQVLHIGGEQDQRPQAGRPDGVALGHGLGGVAHRVQGVGRDADFRRQARHLGDAARVVGDRTKGIQRHDHPRHAQHGRGGDGDAEQARQLEGCDNADDDGQGRQGRGFQRDRQTLDHIGAVARDRGVGHRLDRTEAGAGVELGDDHDARRDQQADDARPEQVHRLDQQPLHLDPAGGDQLMDDPPDRADRQDAGHDEALIQGPHDVAALAQTDEEGADDRGHDADAADRQRQHHHHFDIGLVTEEDGRQHHGRHGRDRIGLEQVGGHAGAVADVVAHVVGDGGGVAGIVLGDAGLDLAHHVAAHVGALGEDAAAQSREDGDQRGAEAQGHKAVDDRAAGRLKAHALGHEGVVARHAQKGAARHEHAGDGPRAEGQVQPLGQAFRRRLRRAHIGPHRDQHPGETGSA